jgi:hypothetical protein
MAQRFQPFERAFLVRPISREYPATSAAKIAASRRVWVMTPRPLPSAVPTETAPGPRAGEREFG